MNRSAGKVIKSGLEAMTGTVITVGGLYFSNTLVYNSTMEYIMKVQKDPLAGAAITMSTILGLNVAILYISRRLYKKAFETFRRNQN